MPPRPEGTDGTDHDYRMVIENRYKVLAQSKSTIPKLLAASGFFLLLRTAWLCLVLVEGLPLPSPVYLLPGLFALTLVIYNLASLGTSKESLPLLKVYNVLQGLTAGVLVLSAWHYRTGVSTNGVPTQLYPHIVSRLAIKGTIPYDPDTSFAAAQGLELFLDLTTGAFLILSTLVSHKLILLKMTMKKEAEAGRAEAGAAKKDRGASGQQEEERETKVVRAAATARSRKRLA